MFYWVTIMFSRLWARPSVIGPPMTPVSVSSMAHFSLRAFVILAALYYLTNISRIFLFWAAFILTRPLATVGDFLDKPISHGGLNFDRITASIVLVVFMLVCILLLPKKPGIHPGEPVKA